MESVHPITLEYVQRNHLMMLGSDVGWIDLLDFIPGLPDESVSDLIATATQSDGRPFANLEWLKQMKQAAGRPQDQIDLKNLP